MSVYFGKFLSFGSNPENWKSTLHNLVGKITKQFQVIINVWRIFYQLFDNFVRRHFNKSTWDEFCEQTHIHGLKFVSNIDYYLFERLFWLILVFLSFYFASTFCIKQISRYLDDPIILTVENDYRNWVYSPMAITYCTHYVDEKIIEQLIQSYWNVTEDCDPETFGDHRHFFEMLGAINAMNIEQIEQFDGIELLANLTGDDLMRIATELKAPHIWNPSFQFVYTEAGLCYSTMNLYTLFDAIGSNISNTNNTTKPKNNFQTTKAAKSQWIKCRALEECFISVNLNHTFDQNVTIYFHAADDVIDITTTLKRTENPFENSLTLTIRFDEIVSSSRISLFGPDRRRCRFDSEIAPNLPFNKYTKNLCIYLCRVEVSMDLCGCRPFFYKIDIGPICNITGMICLSKKNWTRSLNACSCLPSCDSVDYTIIKHDYKTSKPRRMLTIRTDVNRWRFKRDLLFSIEFIFVSFGGAFMLFLSFNLISLAEIIYCCIKYFQQRFFQTEHRTPNSS